MERIAVFPGSFDPITLGHVSIVERALSIFDKIIISVGVNSEKNNMFSLEQRIKWIQDVFVNEPKITVESYSGLTVEFCKEKNAQFILRGLRTSADFEFERSIGQINKKLEKNIETVFLLTETEHTPVSSSIVRDVIKNNGNISGMVPDVVKP